MWKNILTKNPLGLTPLEVILNEFSHELPYFKGLFMDFPNNFDNFWRSLIFVKDPNLVKSCSAVLLEMMHGIDSDRQAYKIHRTMGPLVPEKKLTPQKTFKIKIEKKKK